MDGEEDIPTVEVVDSSTNDKEDVSTQHSSDQLMVDVPQNSMSTNIVDANVPAQSSSEVGESRVELKSESPTQPIPQDDKLSPKASSLTNKELTLGAENESSTKTELLPSLGILPPDDTVSEPSNNAALKPAATVPSPPATCASASNISPSEVLHKVKVIQWKDIEVSIITQNNNGPCPLLAILNALILKGIVTLPKDRPELSGRELVDIVGNAVFDVPHRSVPSDMDRQLEQNTSDAVSILHKLLTGLDVNVKFSGVRDFEFTSELSVFDVLRVPLYHGWVVDPAWDTTSIVGNLSYNQLTNNIIMGQEAEAKDNDLYVKALLCDEFITNSVSQLTVYGLFELCSTLIEEEIAVLFRNNHFSTLYRKNGQLYQLLTDQGFLHEKATWETLSDVDATSTTFVTGTLQRIEVTHSDETPSNMTAEQQISSDQQLAVMLQQEADNQQQSEDDFRKIVDDLRLQNVPDEQMARVLQERENQIAVEDRERPTEADAQDKETSTPHSPSHDAKKKKDCSIL